VTELVNTAKSAAGTALGGAEKRRHVPLFGTAAAWDLPRKGQAYLNLSQSYRPVIFTQAVPSGATNVVNADLAEGRAVQYELGYRAQAFDGLVFDASVFHLEFDDQIGSIALPGGRSTVGNIGRTVHRGAEIAVQYNLFRAFARNSRAALNLYANALLLDAEIKQGALAGRTPQYAPDHLFRTGLIYTRGDQFKLGLTGTLSDASYADDANTAQRYVPAYAIWDLTSEWRVPGTAVRLIGGINNLFSEDYYSRVRPDGIDPAPRRNFYLGAALEF
jgi:Fe(3+) dicitrate transport protein